MSDFTYGWKAEWGNIPSPGSQPASEKKKGRNISEGHTPKLSHDVDFTAGENPIHVVNVITF